MRPHGGDLGLTLRPPESAPRQDQRTCGRLLGVMSTFTSWADAAKSHRTSHDNPIGGCVETCQAPGASRPKSSVDPGASLSVNPGSLKRTIDGFVSTDEVTATEQQLTFPLYAASVTSGILTTQGGLDVDLQGRVKHRDGGCIAGLYAGGGTAVGISGHDSRGYSSGNGLLSACGLGWIIGESLAEQ